MIATVHRKAEGSPPATPACADAGTYPRRRRPSRDSPRAGTHTARTRAGGLLEPARTAMDGSAPAQFQLGSRERAADRPKDFSGRDPSAGSGVRGAWPDLRTAQPRTRIRAHQAPPRVSTRSVCGSRWGNRLATVTAVPGDGTTTGSTSTIGPPVDGGEWAKCTRLAPSTQFRGRRLAARFRSSPQDDA